MIVKFILLTILIISSAFASFDDILCGKKPNSNNEKKKQHKSLNNIAEHMSPIKLQYPSSWCYAFQGIDHLEYHLYLNQKKDGIKSPKEYYTPQRLISVFEVISALKQFQYYQSISTTNDPPQIDIREGRDIFLLFNAIQEFNNLRSFQQMPFNPIERKNKDASIIINKLVEEYKNKHKITNSKVTTIAGIKCPIIIDNDPEFQKSLKTFEIINKKLFNLAEFNKLNIYNKIIKHYEQLANKISGKPTITIPPFISHQYTSKNTTKILKKIKSVLNNGNGRPIAIDICSSDFLDENKKFTLAEGCNYHSMSIIGAGYKNGECIVKLRNTWGKYWRTNGTVDIKAEELIEALKHRSANTKNKITMSWLTNEDEKVVPSIIKGKRQEVTDNNITFLGHIQYTFNKDRINDATKIYGFDKKDGKKIIAHQVPRKNNNVYVGTVIDTGNGEWIPLSGKEYKDGNLIYYYNVKIKDSSGTYTGTTDNSEKFKEGIITYPNGSKSAYP